MYTMQQLLELKEKEAAELRDRIAELQAEGTAAEADELESQKMYLVRAEDQIKRFRLRIAGIDPNSNSRMAR